MKYNTATLFAAAAALVSITSASASVECNQPMPGEPGEPGICPMRPVTPLEIPQNEIPGDQLPCVEVIVRDTECVFKPVRTGPSTTVVSNAYLMAFAECNCSGTTFAHWLDCQTCLLDHGLYDEVSQIWFQILARAKSLLCNSPQPTAAPALPSPAPINTNPPPTTPMPSITTIAPNNMDDPNTHTPITEAPWAGNQTNADVTAAGPQTLCDEEFSKQQDFSITTVTGITTTASPTNQSLSTTAVPTGPFDPIPTGAMVPPGLNTVETTNGASSFEKPGLALVIVGSLILGML
ncbi:hypothetical protein GGI35DRAFT_474607 [Trichoderma velutinum]